MTSSTLPVLRLLAAGSALALMAACSPAADAPADPAANPAAAGHDAAGHGAGHGAAATATPAAATGGSAQLGEIAIAAARIRPPPGGRDVTAGYLTLTNAGAAANRLVSATSPAAASIELHAHIHEGGMMKMEQVPAIDVPAGGSVTLEPGGLHLMLFGVKADMIATGSVPVTLTFEQGGTVDVVFSVTEP